MLIFEVKLPLEDTEIDVRMYEKLLDDEGAGESGGYDAVYGKMEVVQKFPHNGEVHRARYCPQASQYIATKGPSEQVYVFDRTKQPRINDKGPSRPDYVLVGHEHPGWGLSWNNYKQGHILSASDDGLTCLWDLHGTLASTPVALTSSYPYPSAPPASATTINALSIFKGHVGVVEDVQWHPKNETMFGTVGDDHFAMLWDTRSGKEPVHKAEAHNAEVNAIAFNLHNTNLFATGSSDNTVGLWDIRQMKNGKLHSFESHYDQVTSVAWSPFSETILVSGSADRRVIYWDVTKIGQEQTPEDSEDGPPEVLFVHGGHTDKVPLSLIQSFCHPILSVHAAHIYVRVSIVCIDQ